MDVGIALVEQPERAPFCRLLAVEGGATAAALYPALAKRRRMRAPPATIVNGACTARVGGLTRPSCS